VAAAEDGALGAAAAAHVAGARQAICAEEIILSISISISISCSLHCRRRLCAPPASSHEALPLLAALGGEETPEFGRWSRSSSRGTRAGAGAAATSQEFQLAR
jgi:hypothetical protein